MKKILVLTTTLVLAATSCFALASGATGTMTLTTDVGLTLHGDRTTATATTASIGKLSTGVGVAWRTSTAGYTLITQHKSGTKGFGSSYDSTAIYGFTGEKVPGTPALAVPTAIDTTDFVTGWKAM